MATIDIIKTEVERALRFRGKTGAADEEAIKIFDAVHKTVAHVLGHGSNVDQYLRRFRPKTDGKLDRQLGHFVTYEHDTSRYLSGVEITVLDVSARVWLILTCVDVPNTPGNLQWHLSVDGTDNVNIGTAPADTNLLRVSTGIIDRLKTLVVRKAEGKLQ